MADRSIAQVARELGVSDNSLRNWLKQFGIDVGEREGLTTEEQEELRRLRKENKVLCQERKTLRKAAASFAREVTKRFFDDYPKAYFDLKEGRRMLRSLQPQ